MAEEGGINCLQRPWLVIGWRREKRERDEVLLSRCGGLRTREKPENSCLTGAWLGMHLRIPSDPC